ncbi:Nuclear condensin complex subunit 3 domain-containing protein [Paramicrosporidium saccamoebae]|uniref:Nuclear condensin complex subunit 3 domain-containing protein n=1 Tax=Paramicrosporidium saccamoebae TaxID=1246581 RepID=A0A2H9TQ17_9FUNG|nr:Nuclear condensin complex subunit 3 domain-containing protein [Paramicrosporidium saccamoebae]
MRFLVGFLVFSAEKDEVAVLGGTSPTTRLIENVMLYALEGVDTKERMVRVRLTQVLVACVNAMDELSDALWSVFRAKMTERLFDKEAAVRVQAVHAMARLQSMTLCEDSELTVQAVFLELMAHDPVAEVRKAVLGQIDVNETTLEAILLRRRDVDSGIRRFFYAKKMGDIDVRTLSMKQRDNVLRTGLIDRDPNVRRACVEMVFGRWIQAAENNLIQLLMSLDVIGHAPVAEYALKAFYETTPEMFTVFPSAYFENLTPETAIALRVYCEQPGSNAGELLPEMSELAHHAKRIYESILAGDSDDSYRTEAEFMLCELFKVIGVLDGSDEMGRRVVQGLLVDLLSNLELGDVVFSKALELLSKMSPDLDEFLQTVGQLVADLHELHSVPANGLEDQLQKSLESLTLLGGANAVLPEDVRIMAQLRCLEIVMAAFQLPAVSLSRHPAILSLLNEVIIPAVNSPYAVVQTKGLLCLGIACTMSLELSREYLNLLVEFFQHGQDETRLTALKVICDLAFVFGDESILTVLNDKVVSALWDDDVSVQAAAAEGYAKLLLHRILHDSNILAGLLQLYFNTLTTDNPRLCQTLAYFLPAFAYSSVGNQVLLARSVLPVLKSWTPDNGLSLQQVAGQLLELTDPARLSELADRTEEGNAHAELAEELAWAALRSPATTGKVYAALLTRLTVADWPTRTMKRLLFVAGQLIRVIVDRTTLTALKKMVALLVELDDPTQLLEPEDLIDLRAKLAEVDMPERPVLKVTVKNHRPVKQSNLSTVNIMDEIHDLLD